MKSIAIYLAPALLLAAGHAAAAGPLLAGLQPRLSAAAPALATPAWSALPGLSSTLNAGPALPALAATPLAGLESDTSPTAEGWLQYNLYTWPGKVQAWTVETRVHLVSESTKLVWNAGALPSNGEACDSSVCPAERRVAAYAANQIKGVDRILGFAAPRPPVPPLPYLPPDVPYWLYHNYYIYPTQVTAWLAAEDEFMVGQAERFIHDAASVRDAVAAPQYYIGSVTDGALGFAAPRPPLPLPYLPSDPY